MAPVVQRGPAVQSRPSKQWPHPCNNLEAPASSNCREGRALPSTLVGRLLPFGVPTPTAPGGKARMGTGTAWKTLLLLAVLALLFCGSGRLSTVLAQYPPPAGTVTASADEAAAPTDASVEVTCTVQDAARAPGGGVGCT